MGRRGPISDKDKARLSRMLDEQYTYNPDKEWNTQRINELLRLNTSWWFNSQTMRLKCISNRAD